MKYAAGVAITTASTAAPTAATQELRSIVPSAMVSNTLVKLAMVHAVGSSPELSTSPGGRSDSDTR